MNLKTQSEQNDLLAVSSPEDLRGQLNSLRETIRSGPKTCTLAIRDPKVLAYAFGFERISTDEIKDRLMSETVAILTLPANEIDFDFQILSGPANKTSGIFACAPKSVLQRYLSVLDGYNIKAVRVLPLILERMNAFFTQHDLMRHRACLIDVSEENRMFLGIFHHGSCELLREIHFENATDVRRELITSLRSANAKNKDKPLEAIYYSGTHERIAPIFGEIQNIFSLEIKPLGDSHEISAKLFRPSYLTLNLLKCREYTPQERRQLCTLINLFLSLVLIGCIALGMKVTQTKKLIDEIGSSYQPTELDYAKKLHVELESF